MRGPTLALCAVLLAGCNSTTGDSTYGDAWTLMRAAIVASTGNVRVTREQAAAVPYASMGWKVGSGNQAMIVLATDNGGERLWTSAAHIVLVTRDGRLMRSVGLGYDLAGTTPKASGLPSPAAALQAPFTSTRLLDYPDQGRYGVEVTCRSRAVGRFNITILGHATPTTRIDEDCTAPSLRWQFTDSYWVDGDGMVWRARQHFHPRQDPLETVLLRPPG